jgi:hypothetical protein
MYTLEKETIKPHPLIAEVLTEKKILDRIPMEYVNDNEDLYGTLSQQVMSVPTRHTKWKYLFFHNSDVFRPAAIAFQASEKANQNKNINPSYCSFLKGTTSYKKFWKEERRRCLEGYEPEINGEPGGIRIPGEYYFYLNFCRINIVAENKDTGETSEAVDFPDFVTMDYYYFKELELRENPTKFGLPMDYKSHFILSKARRKGFSFKNAGGATWKYTFFADVKIAIIAETGGDALKTFEKCLQNIDFLTQYTEFGGPHIYRTYSETQGKGAIKAGTKDKQGNEKGRKSSIFTVSLNGRPDAAAGLGCVRLIFEEAGKIRNLKKAWKFAEPTLRSGKLLKGIAIIFGTGGDMDGATQDFAEMFYNPEAFKLAAYKNIHEEIEAKGECGWFVDDMWFREGATFVGPDGNIYKAIDKQGNVLRWVAELDLNVEREKAKKGGKDAYNIELTQSCKTPSEAFLVVQGNVFPVIELYARLSRLKANNEFDLLGTNGNLVEETGVISFVPDFKNELQAITEYPQKKGSSREGCIVQNEAPRTINGVTPEGAYIISVDTIRMDTEGGQSLIAIYAVKTKRYAFDIGHDEIVMSYVGRPIYDPIDTANFILYKMGKYYNAKITHENDAAGKSVRDFFVKNKAFHMLMKPPSNIVEKHLTTSRTLLRKSGHSMGSKELVEIGEIYLKQWLLEKRGLNPVTGVEERNLDLISDKALLEELISYNRERNTDRVMALMGAIIQMKNVFNEYVKEDKQRESVTSWFADKALHLPSTDNSPEGIHKKRVHEITKRLSIR